ncbi:MULTISPECIES: helix-turn-helix transcriptional regulator [Burkholderia]|uniref:helix-turn-helix transcriptional regulator n=1 Tax=Burkholderia TaxID=32008 RepID=UPI000B0C2029|nr:MULTISPECIES: AraC family transcriptional regulator [Burkholderia]
MQVVRFLFGRLSGQVRTRGMIHAVPGDCIVVTRDDAALCDAGAGTDIQFADFYAADFRTLYAEISALIDRPEATPFRGEPLRVVPTSPEVIGMLELLAPVSRPALLSFLYVFCLGADRAYFSRLLHAAMAGDTEFVDFVDAHALNPWSVARFAEEFGLPPRKFNLLFVEKYGMSAKRWLVERRLAHAQHLLVSTSMRILDIAHECGFSNHAHFTDSFRRRYLCNPTQYRLRAKRPAATVA